MLILDNTDDPVDLVLLLLCFLTAGVEQFQTRSCHVLRQTGAELKRTKRALMWSSRWSASTRAGASLLPRTSFPASFPPHRCPVLHLPCRRIAAFSRCVVPAEFIDRIGEEKYRILIEECFKWGDFSTAPRSTG